MAENTFKVGDRVRSTVDRGISSNPPKFQPGIIEAVGSEFDSDAYIVRFDDWPSRWDYGAEEIEAAQRPARRQWQARMG